MYEYPRSRGKANDRGASTAQRAVRGHRRSLGFGRWRVSEAPTARGRCRGCGGCGAGGSGHGGNASALVLVLILFVLLLLLVLAPYERAPALGRGHGGGPSARFLSFRDFGGLRAVCERGKQGLWLVGPAHTALCRVGALQSTRLTPLAR